MLWAMTTRMQADVDIVTIPGVRYHPLDPSNDPACSWSIRDHGIACKTIYDATVPLIGSKIPTRKIYGSRCKNSCLILPYRIE
ncbi:MAG: hypothetical protein ACLR2G_00985 [Phascolarctobacterium faecium]